MSELRPHELRPHELRPHEAGDSALPPLEEGLRALGEVSAPAGLRAAVLAEVTKDARKRPLRLSLAAASFAAWAFAVHRLVAWTAEQIAASV